MAAARRCDTLVTADQAFANVAELSLEAW